MNFECRYLDKPCYEYIFDPNLYVNRYILGIEDHFVCIGDNPISCKTSILLDNTYYCKCPNLSILIKRTLVFSLISDRFFAVIHELDNNIFLFLQEGILNMEILTRVFKRLKTLSIKKGTKIKILLILKNIIYKEIDYTNPYFVDINKIVKKVAVMTINSNVKKFEIQNRKYFEDINVAKKWLLL